ncbi:WbqC family protein [Olleya sp. YS]|uniref:WbqC family protein n=1 Tax=Olleya sp. YS TaxID=3028318 RepID=UPI00243416F3|nr:WbqC family protein [Olleya sp. YS]WGD35071.1 WbqC family protein [Olleya sp. YS]
MKKILLHPTYFPSIAQCVAIANAEELIFEMHDNFQKQTYRNRAYIYGANGKLQLSVPIIHSHKERQLYRDVKISDVDKWQLIHLKSFEAAYRTSPYFEFYEDDFQPLFKLKSEFIFDHNLKCFEVISEFLQLDLSPKFTNTFEKTPLDLKDYRYLANARQEKNIVLDPYTQVFNDKHGYINNLSVLDLLFNEGTNALTYLESQTLPDV